jgi:hypothetical protein
LGTPAERRNVSALPAGAETIAMTDEILNRIARESGVEDILRALSDRLSPTDLQSLLLEVYRTKAARISPADLLARYERDRFFQPSTLGAAELGAFDQLAWSLLPDRYDALALSPLCPLGTSSVVGTVDQNKVVSTVRTGEVVADSTNVLALECALRRRALLADAATRRTPVCVATCQEQVRAQGLGAGQTATSACSRCARQTAMGGPSPSNRAPSSNRSPTWPRSLVACGRAGDST